MGRLSLLCIVLIAACGPVPGPTASPEPSPTATPSPSPSPTPTVAFEVTHQIGGLSFITPADWQIVVPRRWTEPGPTLFLSNVPIADPCPTSSRFAKPKNAPVVT